MSQQEESFNNSSTILSSIINNIESGNLHEDLMSSLLPCEAYEKDGFCARGSTCKFKHESAIGNVNLIEFLFEYETNVPKATSKKIRKINEINSEQVTNSNSSQSKSSSSSSFSTASSTTIAKSTSSDKPLIRKSKKTKIEKKPNPENSSSNNSSASSIKIVPVEEPYNVPPEYTEINFEKPIIPFNFSFHTPTFHRQTTLQELIDMNMKSTTNKKKAIVLAFMKEKEIYNSSHDRISYGRTFNKYKKTLASSNNTSTNTTNTTNIKK